MFGDNLPKKLVARPVIQRRIQPKKKPSSTDVVIKEVPVAKVWPPLPEDKRREYNNCCHQQRNTAFNNPNYAKAVNKSAISDKGKTSVEK
jgi:hypothetical protein